MLEELILLNIFIFIWGLVTEFILLTHTPAINTKYVSYQNFDSNLSFPD
jgi:hypothetical protein